MTVELLYSPGDRVLFYCPDDDAEYKGKIDSITINIDHSKNTSIDYLIIGDIEIKSSNEFHIDESDIIEKIN
jgi:hypothetical protein